MNLHTTFSKGTEVRAPGPLLHIPRPHSPVSTERCVYEKPPGWWAMSREHGTPSNAVSNYIICKRNLIVAVLNDVPVKFAECIKCPNSVFFFHRPFGWEPIDDWKVKRGGNCKHSALKNNKIPEKYIWPFQVMKIEVADACKHYYPYERVPAIATVSTFVCKRPNM